MGRIVPTIFRIPSKDLKGFGDQNICEACGKRINKHEWADLDRNGFVVACSEGEKLV